MQGTVKGNVVYHKLVEHPPLHIAMNDMHSNVTEDDYVAMVRIITAQGHHSVYNHLERFTYRPKPRNLMLLYLVGSIIIFVTAAVLALTYLLVGMRKRNVRSDGDDNSDTVNSQQGIIEISRSSDDIPLIPSSIQA